MPDILEEIAYHHEQLMRKHRASVIHIVKSIICIIVISALLEVFLFNINYFRSSGYDTIDLSDKLQLSETTDEEYRLTAVNHTIEFSNLNTHVENIHLDFDEDQTAQLITVKIHFTDEAHSTYFDSTEYTEGVPTVDVSTAVSESGYIHLNTSGIVDSLRIEVVSTDTSYPVLLRGVEINAHEPFNFNVLRFVTCALVIGVLYLLRPHSSIYRVYLRERPRFTKRFIIAAVFVEIIFMSSYLFMGSNLVGIATKNYNSGSWDGSSIVNVYEVGGENAQQYAMLAEALAEGHLYLDEDPPDWLAEMEDPYDKGARDEAQKATGEDYLFDAAYYNGHYYVYFGVVPVLIFYLPFYLLTGQGFPTAIGVLIACIMFTLGCAALLDRFARFHFDRVSLGLYLLLEIPLVMCSGVLYLLKFPTFYSIPIMCALAFSVWGLYLWMRGRSSDHKYAYFLAGSLCMALVLGCRPQLMVFSFVAFPLFWRAYITKRRLFTRKGAREFACLIAPYIVVGVGIMAYNYLRFGSPLDFGANYNLTVNDMTRRGFSLGRIAPALFAFFIQAPNICGKFPFVQATVFATTYMGQTIKEATFGGIFACLPILWILPFAPSILKMRFAQRSTHTIAGVIIVLISSGLLVGVLDAEMAGILQRYFADFSFMFLASAVLLAFITNENLPVGSRSARVFNEILLAMVLVSVIYITCVCFVPETGWYSDVYDWAYQAIVETFEFWT